MNLYMSEDCQMRGQCGKGWFKFVLMVLVGIAAAGFVVMLLWNWLVPTIFGWQEIQFVQALGLMLLARLIFGGFRHGRDGFHAHWQSHMDDRWNKMTPEEREKFQSGMHRCWGHKNSEEPAEKV
jgi:hypothetical protein